MRVDSCENLNLKPGIVHTLTRERKNVSPSDLSIPLGNQPRFQGIDMFLVIFNPWIFKVVLDFHRMTPVNKERWVEGFNRSGTKRRWRSFFGITQTSNPNVRLVSVLGKQITATKNRKASMSVAQKFYHDWPCWEFPEGSLHRRKLRFPFRCMTKFGHATYHHLLLHVASMYPDTSSRRRSQDT